MVTTCEEGDWFTPHKAEKGQTVDELQGYFEKFKDPPPEPGTSKECFECDKAKRLQKVKCENVRKRVAHALKEAGCPSVVKAYKKPAKKKSCPKKKSTTKKTTSKTSKTACKVC